METSSEDLLELLRRCGVALCLAGEAASRIPDELAQVADAYGVRDVHFLIVPTGVFVRLGSGPDRTVDFSTAEGDPLRLDQVGRLYKLIEEIKADPIPPAEALRRLDELMHSPPRFNAALIVLGNAVLTMGLALMLLRDGRALLIMGVLGLFVGVLRLLAGRIQVLSLALPVVAAMLITFIAYRYANELGLDPSRLIIPALATFLPGAALTLGALEMGTGSMISGSSRLVSGVYVLLLLSFGILVGASIADEAIVVVPGETLGRWAPWAGVLIFGIGLYFSNSAPRRSLFWLLTILYVAYAAQLAATHLAGGPSSPNGTATLFGAFAGGLVIVPIATVIRKLGGPPTQVAFLPAFWLLVPGALGLTGVSQLVDRNTGAGSGVVTLMTAFLSVIAVALGVLVGSSLTSTATASSRLAAARST